MRQVEQDQGRCFRVRAIYIDHRLPLWTSEQKQTGVVYEIPCKDCPEVYVGETKRTLKVRLSEHRQAVK